jgi:hypothetical protein
MAFTVLSSPSWPKLQRRPSVDVILAILGDVEHEGQHHTANKQPPHLYHSDELHTILEGLLMEHGGNAASLPFPRAESPLLNMRQVVDDNSTSSSYGSECQSLAELVGDDFLDDLETTMEEFTENLSQDFDRLMQEVAVL